MKRRTGTGRWRWALMLPVLVFLLGESSGQREEGRSLARLAIWGTYGPPALFRP